MILSHELFGTGKEGVIVMHAFYGCKDTWSFARKFFNTSEFTFAFTEVRGYGDSRHFLGEYSPKEASTDILKLADNLGWDSFHIMGHSMSGMLAQRVMLDGGSRVQSAILNTPVAASGLSFSPEGFALIEESIDSNKALVRAFNALAGERLGKEWSDFKVRQTRANRLKKAQSEYFKNCRDQGFLEEVVGIKTPTLVIIGEYDMEPFTLSTAMETFAKWYPNSDIQVCGNAAHYPQQETPVYFAKLVNDFLSDKIMIS